MSDIRIGTCGFCLNQRAYFQAFPLIEIQQTFYQPPRLSTAERWRQSAPPDFEFALKAFQAITHLSASPTYRRCRLSENDRAGCGFFRDTEVVRTAWNTTLAIARALHAQIVIFQCPASFGPREENIANMRHFFQWAQREDLVFGWEPRGPAWTPALVSDLCREQDLIHVVDPFLQQPTFGKFRYLRLHGIGGYQYRYSDDELEQLRNHCAGKLTYCMFNNTNMLEDAQRFQKMLEPARG